MKIIIIVGFEEKTGAIGSKGQLYYSPKQDMEHFRRTTRKTFAENRQNLVIMGRNTWDSLPTKISTGQKALDGRKNIVLTSRPLTAEYLDQIQVFNTVDGILDYIRTYDAEYENAYVIGGGKVYEAFLRRDLVDEIVATVYVAKREIDQPADAFFPLDYLSGFKKTREEFLMEDLNFRASVCYYKRLAKTD